MSRSTHWLRHAQGWRDARRARGLRARVLAWLNSEGARKLWRVLFPPERKGW